ncbi:MAG: DNA-directed RNA polymerase subunit beta' [Armatimonadetes bacterium]|nr:DNA-directed RNA polymerase subunit beta' [Armatimonadota bacterium]
MADSRAFDKIRIGIASPDEIKGWSCGEVKKPETINYRTFKPERDGLFCERIFGPVKDWECHCGRYKKVKFKGIVCDRCGVEVTRSKVRRERMGHIELAAPVSHIWYLKGVPSPMSLILDISPRPLERVLYFASYIVTHIDRQLINEHLDKIRSAVSAEEEQIVAERDAAIAKLRKEQAKEQKEHEAEWTEQETEASKKQLADGIKQEEREANERIEELGTTLKLLESVQRRELINDDQYRALLRLLDVLTQRLDADFSDALRAGMGGAAIKELLAEVDLEKLSRELRKEIQQTQGPKRARAIKRLEVVEAFVNSKSRPEWMIFEVVPVISPELRPMVQLDGGRFATSDLNDLYRRIINRNNRLKKITEIRAPESIINHEKRLLQEAVDALIDNGRRARPVVGSNNRPLKSLSDMLKGKEGRFRKTLLGKRVDYSGRSVIVDGPELKMHQCGLPKEMALELFKPFVMKTLVERQYTSNIKTAKRMIDKMKPEVWDALEEVIKEHPVLLNRAPTLHRLGIQAFEPILVDGKAIQVHPLVCHAFNADFDGDQMAVHVPLSATAQAEARILMLSTHNLFSPADGRPIVAPIQDIVLGAYYLTQKRDAAEGQELPTFANEQEAVFAYSNGTLDLHEPVRVRITKNGLREVRETSVGRLIFNQALPDEMEFVDADIDKKVMATLVTECHSKFGVERTVKLLDDLKSIGFRYSTFGGITISMTDMDIPGKRDEIVSQTEEKVAKLNRYYHRGQITQAERKQQVLELWTQASEQVAEAILEKIDTFNPIYMMTNSGARGSKRQITQLSGMRGLMSDPFGNLIEDLPIKSNFHEGLNVLEYFISTHGARKGLADTALRTADAGYLTRRLVDVAQDVIVRGRDCETVQGIQVSRIEEGGEVIEDLWERIAGRYALEDIYLPGESEPIVLASEEIDNAAAREIDEAGIRRIGIRSPLFCELRQGICAKCYGRDMATGKLVEAGTAVGIIAAQSIGEPGTQLTMRTFHTGGVAGKYLTGVAEVKKKKQESLRELHDDVRRGLVSFEEEGVHGAERERVRAVQAVLKVLEDQVRGLLRVVELFEGRKPKGQAIITEVSGKIVDIDTRGLKRVIIHSTVPVVDTSSISGEVAAENVVDPESGDTIISAGTDITERLARRIVEAAVQEVILRKTHLVPHRGKLNVEVGDEVSPGDRLTEGPLDPQKVLELRGVHGVMDYLVSEIQSVYKSQGVDINDKHVEIIVRQMLKRRRVNEAGDTKFLPGQIVDKFNFEDENARVRAQAGTEATADWVLLGITEASLATDSFLSAASFQKTTRVLTEAAVKGKRDNLVGLKENVIIGRLIPAGTGLPRFRSLDVMDESFQPIVTPRELLAPTREVIEEEEEEEEELLALASSETETEEEEEESEESEVVEDTEAEDESESEDEEADVTDVDLSEDEDIDPDAISDAEDEPVVEEDSSI